MRKGALQANRQRAEVLAVQALSFVAAEPERLGRFLALTGIGPEDIRRIAHESGFLAGILDYVVADERLLKAFADEAQTTPQAVGAALIVLGGPTWEREAP